MACLTLTTPRAMRSHSNGGGRAADVTARPLRFCVFVYSFEKWNRAKSSSFSVVLTPATGQRIFCRPCLDWSERRYHIAGHLGSEPARATTQVARATRHCGPPARVPHEFRRETAFGEYLEIATVIPMYLTGCTAWPWPFFHSRNCCVRAAASGCACAESYGERNATSPSPGLYRHPKGARQRRLHRGRGSGRGRRLDVPARARLDRLPAAARSRAACLGRDGHRLDAPRRLTGCKICGRNARLASARRQRRVCRSQGSGMSSDGKCFMSTGCATWRS